MPSNNCFQNLYRFKQKQGKIRRGCSIFDKLLNSGHQGDFWNDYNVMQVMLDVNERLVGMKMIANGGV